MSWVKLDDSFLADAKFRRADKLAPSTAVHLWCAMVAYCSRDLTDGFVPVDMLDEINGPRSSRAREKALDALSNVGLIAPLSQNDVPMSARRTLVGAAPDDCRVVAGYSVVGYLKFNPSRAEVLEKRERAAQLKRNQRDSDDVHLGQSDSVGDGQPEDSNETPHAHPCDPVPSRPVPSRPGPRLVGAEAPQDPDPPPVAVEPRKVEPKPKERRRAQLPDDFEPNATCISVAQGLGVDLSRELPKFRDFHTAKGNKMIDWQAALRTWIRNAETWNRGRGPSPSQGNSALDRQLRRVAELEAAERNGGQS